MIIHDSHVHIGQFRELYSSPESVLDFMTHMGIDKIAVSSTTTTSGVWQMALDEMLQMVEVGTNRVVPVLWLNPEWLCDGTADKMLHSGINWKCLKIHGYFSRWEDYPEMLRQVVDIARKMNIPILLHTGGRPESDCISYLDVISGNPDVTFILAHSRPVDQAIKVMKSCPNAFADTAFTPIEGIGEMISDGLSDRIMWGTDYPLHNVFYEGKDIKSLIADKLEKIRQMTSQEQFNDITYRNFEKLFTI